MKFCVYRQELSCNKYVTVCDAIEGDYLHLQSQSGEGKPCLLIYRKEGEGRSIVAGYAGGTWLRAVPAESGEEKK